MLAKRKLLSILGATTAAVILVTYFVLGHPAQQPLPLIAASKIAVLDTGKASKPIPALVLAEQRASSPAIAARLLSASIGGQLDLWAYANAMRTSTEPSRLVEARHAVAECRGMTLLDPEMSSFVSGGNSRIGGSLTPERQMAYQNLISKCSGFRAAGDAAVKSLSDDLLQQMKAYAPGILESSTVASFSAEQKIELAYSGSASAIAQSLPAIARDWARVKGFTDRNSDERNDMFLAAALAACDLGTDCSEKGFDTEMECVLANRCISTAEQGLSGLTEERKLRVAGYKRQLVTAISTKDLSGLGLTATNMGDLPAGETESQ